VNAELGITQRKDGSMQLTVNGMPVYHYFQDSKPGDTNGQGVGSVWFVLNPDGNLVQK
jgi:predicted lipoprotein with Yx(FWY)xxD motif